LRRSGPPEAWPCGGLALRRPGLAEVWPPGGQTSREHRTTHPRQSLLSALLNPAAALTTAAGATEFAKQLLEVSRILLILQETHHIAEGYP